MKKVKIIVGCVLIGTILITGIPASTAYATNKAEFTAADAYRSSEIKSMTERSQVLDESDIIYMILTDRFYDGDPSNNGKKGYEYRPGQLKYTQGGDWKGIRQKLDYIKDLGVTAIWISPPSENELLSRDGNESGYHGYFTHDYNKADPHYGSKQDLIDLVSEAHQKGLKVVLDVVPNHTADYFKGSSSTYDSMEYQPAAPFVFVKDSIPEYREPERVVTTIRVHCDAGYGNTMYLRGNSYPLTWDSGRSMLNISSEVWTYETERIPKNASFEFKAMFNDKKWSTGANFKGVGGTVIDVYPSF